MELLADHHVALWLVADDQVEPARLATYWPLLTLEEQQRASRFYFEHDRKSHIIARALVRTVLSRYADVQPDEWRFVAGPYGQPRLAPDQFARTGLSFNLSHTRGLVAIAVRRWLEVGVDAEHLHFRPPPLDVAERYFAPSEIAALDAAPQGSRDRMFFELWTLKESYIKARGAGLSLPLQQFAFTLGGSPAITIDPGLGDLASRWRFWQVRPSEHHVLAVCAQRSGHHDVLVVRHTVPLADDRASAAEHGRIEDPGCGSNSTS